MVTIGHGLGDQAHRVGQVGAQSGAHFTEAQAVVVRIETELAESAVETRLLAVARHRAQVDAPVEIGRGRRSTRQQQGASGGERD